MRKLFTSLVLTLAVALVPLEAHAIVLVDYLGYAFETGGFLPSEVGDELVFTCVATEVSPLTGTSLDLYEVTFYAYGLISSGSFVDGAGNTIVNYVGGTLEVRRDPSFNADWGVNPPNATSPSTFADGTLLFEGSFNSFTVAIQPDGSGVYEGYLDGVAGLILQNICSDCAYTWGGAWTADAGAQIIEGYDLQIDGKLDVLEAVPTENSDWGRVKSDYRP
jgi:hypothetical protein